MRGRGVSHHRCCCDPADLLRAIPCEACCPEYGAGLPVDPAAVPDWGRLPVFYLHGKCWRITGAWDAEPPPDETIIRSVYDFLRWANCPGCIFGIPDCPILTPGCDAVGLQPDNFTIDVRSVGAGALFAGGTPVDWDFTVRTVVVAKANRCRPGCRTDPCVNLQGGEWHTGSDWIQTRRTTFSGYYRIGANRYDAQAGPEFVSPFYDVWACHHSAGPTQGLGQARCVAEGFGNSLLVRARWSSGYPDPETFGGFFWLKGEALQKHCEIEPSGTGTGEGIADTYWDLTIDLACCEDAPERPAPGGPGTIDPGGMAHIDRIEAQLRGGCCGQ